MSLKLCTILQNYKTLHTLLRAIHSYKENYTAIKSYTGLFSAIKKSYTGLYGAILGYAQFYKATQGYKKILQSYTKILRATKGYTQLYRAMQGSKKLYKPTAGYTTCCANFTTFNVKSPNH